MKKTNSIHAKKSLGQNFLHHQGTLAKIIETADLKPTDYVVEIGPGHGILTQALLLRSKHVTSIELDTRLIPELTQKFATPITEEKLTLLHQDALDWTPPSTPYKLVANIPYYITSPLLNHFLREQPENRRPQLLVLLVQKEVAQKICPVPHPSANLNVLALQVQLFGTPKIIAKIPSSHFSPAPKVDSAILHIEIKKPPLADKNIPRFFQIIHAGFAHKRKKLIRNLEAVLPKTTLKTLFKKLNLSENTRAEELNLVEWIQFLA